MTVVKTMCARDCPDACFLDVEVRDGAISRVRASRENPVTAGITCPRAMGDPQRVYSMRRVLNPYVRPDKASPGFKLSTWDEALSLTASRLRETIKTHGRESVLLLDYSGNTGLITSGFSKRLWNALGATRTDYTVCSASGHAALRLHYGLSYGVEPEGLLDRGIIVFWGFNARHSSPHMWAMAMRARKEKGAVIVVVDPRRSESADMADLWLYPRPGSDVALCYGVARSLITGNRVDQGFIRAHTSGFDAYRDEALRWTPEMVEGATGVEWEGVAELAEALAEHEPPVFMIGIGLQKGGAGAEAVRAVSLLPALLGQHRGLYYTNSRGRYLGGDLGGGSLSPLKPKVVSQISLGERLARGEFKFVYVFGMNPVLTLPDSGRVAEGLKRGDVFLVVHETHITETCDLADVVLPAPTYLEKDDVILCDSHPYVRRAMKAVEPEGLSRDEVSVMRELAHLLKLEESWVYAEPWEEAEKALDGAFADGCFQDYMRGGCLRLRLRPLDQYQTPTGKIEFTASDPPEGITALPRQMEPEDTGELTLLNSSVPRYTHTQFRDVYGENTTETWINPLDAEKNGVRDGEPGTLMNELGSLSVTFKVTDRVHPGVLWMSRELVDRSGCPQNRLAPGAPQRIGGGPKFNSIKVRIS